MLKIHPQCAFAAVAVDAARGAVLPKHPQRFFPCCFRRQFNQTPSIIPTTSRAEQYCGTPGRGAGGEGPSDAPPSSTLNHQPLNLKPSLRLHFVTPLLLKSGSGINENGDRVPAQEIRERPPMGVIIRRLRDRLSSLCAFFGERWDCPDFAAWGTLADQVRIVDSRTTWLTRNRRSTRTGHAHEISGLVGYATYEFPDQTTFETLTPLLRVGELLHVGKNAPWGTAG